MSLGSRIAPFHRAYGQDPAAIPDDSPGQAVGLVRSLNASAREMSELLTTPLKAILDKGSYAKSASADR